MFAHTSVLVLHHWGAYLLRILSRPWAQDPFMKEVLQRTITENGAAITQLIQHSPDVSHVFSEYCKQVATSVRATRVRNLRMAKHRYDSLQRPLGRTILWMDAMLLTVIWYTVNRAKNEAARHCQLFLDWIDEEKIMLLAMMADGADEALSLVRFLDSETHDVAQVPLRCTTFVNRLNFLFVEGRCVSFGYCAYAMELLQTPRGFYARGVPKTLGGPGRITEGIIKKCLAHMCCWVRLAVTTLQA